MATAFVSPWSAVSLFVSTGYSSYLGEVSISKSGCEASRVLAMRLVYTIVPEDLVYKEIYIITVFLGFGT
jgi:hypothetical protein